MQAQARPRPHNPTSQIVLPTPQDVLRKFYTELGSASPEERHAYVRSRKELPLPDLSVYNSDYQTRASGYTRTDWSPTYALGSSIGRISLSPDYENAGAPPAIPWEALTLNTPLSPPPTAPSTSTDPPQSIVYLPLELHAYIIEFLVEDSPRTIANCALVCRALLPISLRALYYQVDLGKREQWNAFSALMCISAATSSEGEEYPMTKYLQSVRDLRLLPQDYECRGDPNVGFQEGQLKPWANDVLGACATGLTGLTRIQTIDMSWEPALSPSPFPPSGSMWYGTVTELVIVDCTFSTAEQLHRHICSFSSLSFLRLIRTYLVSSDHAFKFNLNAKVPLPLIPENLKRLEFDLLMPTDLSKWLSRSRLLSGLTSIKIEPISVDHFGSVEKAIKIIFGALSGQKLEEFRCETDVYWPKCMHLFFVSTFLDFVCI